MAESLLQHVLKYASTTLNCVSLSIISDIILHPFDFATVLLQVGYDPEGVKDETAAFISVIVQYAIFTIYIPYLLASMQGVHFMGVPHPGMFYYVHYIFKKEGINGCYRGLTPKICERLVMVYTGECVKKMLNRGQGRRSSVTSTSRYQDQTDEDKFMQVLINNMCCHFFAVMASHPFHVIMVTSFMEFMCQKKSTMSQLASLIYEKDGYFGFFVGLAPRLVGELLSLIFSIVYTSFVIKQNQPRQEIILENEALEGNQSPTRNENTSLLVNYVTHITRFADFRQQKEPTAVAMAADVSLQPTTSSRSNFSNRPRTIYQITTHYYVTVCDFFGNLTETEAFRRIARTAQQRSCPSTFRRTSFLRNLLSCVPINSKTFYYIMIRDFIAKKISYPFFLVCHCMIILDTGWDKLPLMPYFEPMTKFLHILMPKRKHNACIH